MRRKIILLFARKQNEIVTLRNEQKEYIADELA